MELSAESLVSFFRLIARIDGGAGGVPSDPEFKETLGRAQMAVNEWAGVTGGDRLGFISAPVVSALLSALYIRKGRVMEAALTTLHQLVQFSGIRYVMPIVLYQSQTSKQALRCGDAIFCALGDFFVYATNSALQFKVLEILHALVSDDDFPSFTGKCVTCCVQICCQATLQSSEEGLRTVSRDLLLLCYLRVTRAFIEAAPPEGQSSTFVSSTMLENFIHDVEPDANHTHVEVVDFVTPFINSSKPDALDTTAMTTAAAAAAVSPSGRQQGNPGVHTSTSSSLIHSLDHLRLSFNDSIMTSALSVLKEKGQFPNAMKDFMLLIRHASQVATRVSSGSGSTSDENPEVRVRQLGLEMLEALFAAIPVANCHTEHHCARWLSLVFAATKYDLLRCIARNLSTIIPSCFFTTSVRILTLLLRKCHYHLARELHTLLAVMLFPLIQSKFSSFPQKCAVLGMVRELLSTPHLCVSFFINYDCNPAFDPAAKYGGMLELMVDFVVGMTFTNFLEGEWLSSDQQQLLRGECASAIHSLVQSMLRWIAEDPQEYTHQQMREAAGQALGRRGSANQEVDHWHEVYTDDWESDTAERDSTASENLSRDFGKFSTNVDAAAAALDQQASGKHPKVGYHWKHIHYLLQNKRIAQEALQHINKGNWREGINLLQQRRCIPKLETNEAECWTAFAQFLKTYPGVERSALCKIFEQVLKDPDCDRILKEYLSLFHYKDVPVDIALRDTTCEFMSWDRPTFEAQVWSVIQERFGEAYGAQNPRYITTKDASAVAGVLLFLHTNLHNENARAHRMPIEEFVRNGNQCLEFSLPEEEMREMYHRVAGRKWELDGLQRTPQQVEIEMSAPTFSERIGQQQQQQQQQGRSFASTQTDAASDVLMSSLSHEDSMGSLRKRSNLLNFPEDVSLLDAEVPPYTTHLDGFKLRDSYHQRYVHVAAQYLSRLELEHRLQRLERCGAQPYAVPHYAQHVRPMLLMLYPQIAATMYMCFRVLEEHPIFRLLLDTYQMLYDVAAAFVVNLGGMRVAVECKIQRCLAHVGAQRLSPPARASFILPLLNLI